MLPAQCQNVDDSGGQECDGQTMTQGDMYKHYCLWLRGCSLYGTEPCSS